MLKEVLEDKRTGQEPVPADLDRFLNQLQITTLRKIEDFGWRLWFVRRPLFQPVVAVVSNPERSNTAIPEDDGSMNKQHGLMLRV